MASAVINAGSSGDNVIVAAPAAGFCVVVQEYVLVAAAAVTAQWNSDVSTGSQTALSGTMSLAANGGVSSAHAAKGLFATASGVALVLTLGGAVSVEGH